MKIKKQWKEKNLNRVSKFNVFDKINICSNASIEILELLTLKIIIRRRKN